MTIDKALIRSYLDEIGIATSIDEDGDILILQGADSDFAHDVLIYVIVKDNKLSYIAGAKDYTPAGDLHLLANRHNCRAVLPTAVVRGGHLRMEYSFLLDEEVSKEYIVENCIKFVLGSIWRAFAQLEKEI